VRELEGCGGRAHRGDCSLRDEVSCILRPWN
jgi:hypothetical protein